jgi:GT2 family glycosyltransferase
MTAVVITTFNRPNMLRRCLEAIGSQTRPPDVVVIVDNGDHQNALGDATGNIASDFSTGSRRPAIEVLRPMVNLGPAGGFSRGIARACALGAQWLWVMDDDVEAEPACLGTLLHATTSTGPAAVYWPTVLGADGQPDECPGWWGFLLPSELVRIHGVPREDFVWWAEDTEYLQWRLGELGRVASIRVDGARVHHRHTPRGMVSDWKLYYEARNATFLRMHLKRHNYRRLLRLWGYLLRQSLATPSGSSRLHRLTLAATGVAHGVAGKLGRRIEPGTARRLPPQMW